MDTFSTRNVFPRGLRGKFPNIFSYYKDNHLYSFTFSNNNCPQCRRHLNGYSAREICHRIYLPEFVNNKDDIMERLTDVASQNETLKLENVEIQKKLKRKNKDFQNLLNKKKKWSKKHKLDESKFKFYLLVHF